MVNYKFFIKLFLFLMLVFFSSTGCEKKTVSKKQRLIALSIPLYIYPTTLNPQTKNSYWNDVANASSYNIKITAIINPSNGDHGIYRDENFFKGIKHLEESGISVLGYTYTQYTHREQSLIRKSIDFYKNKYQVENFFLDEVNSSNEAVPYYKELQFYINKDAKSNEVMLNPGVIPNNILMNDSTMKRVVFEGNYKTFIDEFNTTNLPEESRKYNVCLIYDVKKEQMKDSIDLAIVKHCGELYITDDRGNNPWDTLPTYWNAIIKYIDKINSI
jgi:hypothetical protein